MSISVEKYSGRSITFVLRDGATALATSLLLLATGPASAGATFTTFDVEGASATYAREISADDAVTGYYADSSGNYHGFVRAADGTITSFVSGPILSSEQTAP